VNKFLSPLHGLIIRGAFYNSMATIIENWVKHFESEADRINRDKGMTKDEKVARIHSDRAKMVHNARITLGDYQRRLEGERSKLDNLLSVRHKKTAYPLTEVGQLMRMNDFMQATQFKAELLGLSERNFIRLFERKWIEEDIFSVNLMMDIAEDTLSPAVFNRFTEQYKKLSAEGFYQAEKTAVSNILNYENEIVGFEQFLKKENDDDDKCAG
jgi:hypothetical protein